jgi:hypothetical protein
MAVFDTLVTTAAGAVAATVGVLVGGVVTRRGQDRQWMRDKQLAVYVDLLRHYARFTMEIKRARDDGRGWDYDWGEWSGTLTAASVVAPTAVATEIDSFGRAVNTFLDRVARGAGPVSSEEFEDASVAAGRAQVALVNAMRRSLGKDQGPLTFWIGGALAGPAENRNDER